jgi:hypothetical protein
LKRAFLFLGLAAAGGGLGACALVTGLGDYTAVTLDASSSTKPKDTGSDAPVIVGDEPSSDDATDDGPVTSQDDASDAEGDDAGDATDAPSSDDADAAPIEGGSEDANGGGDDASDGGPGQPDASDGGCARPVTHLNMIVPIGQTFTDCAPLNTFDETQAMEACQASNGGACTMNANVCVAGDKAIVCNTGTPCECYSGNNVGHMSKSGLGALCACPGPTDPFWN